MSYHQETYLPTTRLLVARALRDNPELRDVGKRIELYEKVKETSPFKINPETVTRMARLLQNELGLYTVDDDRVEKQNEYCQYFKRK